MQTVLKIYLNTQKIETMENFAKFLLGNYALLIYSRQKGKIN